MVYHLFPFSDIFH